MYSMVVNENEVADVVAQIEAKSVYKLGATSTVGLSSGRVRLTFLPKEAFTSEANDNNTGKLLVE